jgi:hypothetical protein
MKQCSSCGGEKPLSEFYARSGACKPCVKEKKKAEYKKNPDKFREKELKKNYGITLQDWNNMFEAQEGQCAICKTHQCNTGKSFAVDHDHKTGKVRALLCANCNTGLGKFNDNIETLERAVQYLKASAG